MREAEIRAAEVEALTSAERGVLAGAERGDPRRPRLAGRATPGKQAAATTGGAGEGTMRGPRVLVVEDDTLVSLDIRCILEESGYRVAGSMSRVGHAMDFLERLDEALDCAVLDVEVAGQTCLPVARALDDLGVPYLLVTGHDRATVRKLGLRGDVVEKPFLDRQLATLLSAMIEPRAANGAAAPRPSAPGAARSRGRACGRLDAPRHFRPPMV